MNEQEPVPVQRYGYEWSYGVSDSAIELACFRNYGVVKNWDTGHTRGFHFENAIKLILPERTVDGRVGYQMSKWSERRIQSFIAEDRKFQTWWGSKAAGKSTDAAAIIFVYYLAAPDCTAAQICSTSKSALMKRIWSELVRFYQMYPQNEMPMEYFRGKPAFQYKILNSNQVAEKAGIFGRALLRGTVSEAVGEIIGVHNEYNVLVIDELQASRWAGVEAFDNLDSGREAKFLGMGNPVSRLDPLGLASKPKAGWNSISPSMQEWETEKGFCLYFDGLLSPGIEEPEKYWYLITKDQVETLRKDPGENTPRFWTMARGWIPPEGLVQTVITESLIQMFDIQKKVTWAVRPVLLASLDGAFSQSGDRCELIEAEVGLTIDGVMVIQIVKETAINIEVNEGEPIEYFVMRRVRDHCTARGIPPSHFALDVSATQTSFAAIFEKEWGPDIFRCQFGGQAIGERIGEHDLRPAKDVYWNRVTELWYNARAFAINGQLKGLSDDGCREGCSRLVLQKGGKIAVESKDEYKDRTSQSPDIFDGYTLIVAMAMERFNMRPGANTFGDQVESVSEEQARALDVSREEDAYTGDPVPIDDEELDRIPLV